VTTTSTEPSADPAEPSAAVVPRLRWWREVLYILAIYFVYSTVRNQFGSAGGPAGQSNGIAYEHALQIIRIEDAVGLYFEQQLQEWYLGLPADGWIGFWNVFYGTAHFLVTAGALIWLYHAAKDRYPVWRNTIAFTTVFALAGFAAYSLMPPRLLDAPFEDFGPPPEIWEGPHGYVDTLAEFPTFWSFDSEELKSISNQYAAMPSLHAAWSTWSALVMASLVRRRWLKGLIWLYPAATLFCIVVTANHFWLDALGGLTVLAAGFLAGRALARFWERRAFAAAPAVGDAVPQAG
jgi:hypothetical protein